MTGFLIPGSDAPGSAPPGPDRLAARFVLADLPNAPGEFLIELGSAPPVSAMDLASLGQPGGHAVGGLPDAAGAGIPAGTVLRYSLRGWIGEPGDAMRPNAPFQPRLVEPPALVRSIGVLPEDGARSSFSAGEAVLRNEDRGLDLVASDWSLAGRPAVIRRGPHRTPLRAGYREFGRVAELRVVSAVRTAADRITVALREASTDLSVPLVPPYAGTGDLEGDTSLAGQPRPWLGGTVFNIPATALLAGEGIYQIAAVPLAAVTGVRDQGAPYALMGDHPTLAALRAATLTVTQCATCLSAGLIRLGSAPVGQVTCDAVAAGGQSHGEIALALLRGPGGLGDERIDPSGWLGVLPPGVAGFYRSGGTVTQAIDDIVTACAGWWGADRLGRYAAGRIPVPDRAAPALALRSWMLDGDPVEVPWTARRWRQRVGYRQLGLVQSATDLAGLAADDPGQAARYGTAFEVATTFDPLTFSSAPGAGDPAPLVSGFAGEADAKALADYLLALHAPRRRRWRLSLGRYGHLLDLGDVVTVEHPWLSSRNWVAVSRDDRGDAGTVEVWG
jgi:hypothetical protein